MKTGEVHTTTFTNVKMQKRLWRLFMGTSLSYKRPHLNNGRKPTARRK